MVGKAILFLLSLAFLNAQEQSVRIVVKDSSGGLVPKAYVVFLQHRERKPPKATASDTPTVDAIAQTDARGEAILRCLPGRRYRVEIRAYGFQPWNLPDFRANKSVLEAVLAVGFFVIY